ncbi:MAG: hypothetical protein KatS3mg055_3713 [Chloroflexus sp.]|jgi:hypothetical protein|nr:MAG: hypothetical protein KatS3mg055_3713 [Chloroflexus sp.]
MPALIWSGQVKIEFHSERFLEMIVLNYAHPITTAQQEQIVALTGQSIAQLIDINSQIDQQQPLEPQIIALADAAGLTPQQWQSEEILVNLPSLNFSAAALLAELHGRMGYFPPVLRLRPIAGALPPRFEVAEILNLQVLRDEARARRTR